MGDRSKSLAPLWFQHVILPARLLGVVLSIGLPATALASDGVVFAGLEIGVSETTWTEQRAAIIAGEPTTEVGDFFEVEVEALPIQLGAATESAGAWITIYVPEGLSVVGAGFVVDTATGTAPATPRPGGRHVDGYGPELPVFSGDWATRAEPECASADPSCSGTFADLYADTGVFYSVDEATALGAPVAIDPAHAADASERIDVDGFTLRNAWDVAQVRAFGTDVGAGASEVASLIGAIPFRAGSPVAGPQSGLSLDASSAVGPWERIAIRGAEVAVPAPALGSGDPSDRTGVLTAEGASVGDSSPLPAETNAVRFAFGQVRAGDPARVLVRFHVDESPPAGGHLIVAEAFAGSSATVGEGNHWSGIAPVSASLSTSLPVRSEWPAAPMGLSSVAELVFDTSFLVGGLDPLFEPSHTARFEGPLTAAVEGASTEGADLFPSDPSSPGAGERFGLRLPPILVPGLASRAQYSLEVEPSDEVVAHFELSAAAMSEPARWSSVVSRGARPLLRVGLSTEDGRSSAATRYRLDVENVGTRTCVGFDLEVELPVDASFVEGSEAFERLAPQPPVLDGRFVSWDLIRNLSPGESIAIEFDVSSASATCTAGLLGVTTRYRAVSFDAEHAHWSTAAYESVSDFDGDGIGNADECMLGTDPVLEDTDLDGCSDFDEVMTTPPTDPTAPDTDDGGVEDCDELLDGTDGTIPWDDVGFDFDDDGLDNELELLLFGTDPTRSDSDDGGMSDGDEIALGTDPTDPTDDPGFDFDDDGLDNEVEVALGTLPDESDTDGDGCLDGDEIESNPRLFDTDGGGVGDCDEISGGSDPSDPTDDPGRDFDGDGAPNDVELAAGSDPTLPDTDGDGCDDGDELFGTFTSDPTVRDTDGGGMEDCDERDAGTDARAAFDDPGFDFDDDGLDNELEGPAGGDPTRPDTDGDGCLDGVEVAAGSRPDIRDTDGGGTEDCEEISGGFDPANPADDPAGDPDDDGLTNAEEALAGSDPTRADTDGDGCSDGAEVHSEPTSDPTLFDTDGGGVGDCEERADGTLPRVTFDDIGHDFDEDGIPNEAEAGFGTDPSDPDSDDDGCVDGDELTSIPPTDPAEFDTDAGGVGDCDELADGTDPTDLWDDIGGDGDGDGLPNEREEEVGANPREPDTDGDGCLDGFEMALARPTRPDRVDSDRGGAGDCDELADGTDPWDRYDDTGFDADRDGVPNEVELAAGMDPSRPDSDGGGTSDTIEFERDDLDPLDPSDDPAADPDGDGLSNEEEFFLGTDPANPDTDGDGRTDGEEVHGDVRSDPLDPDSDGGGADDGTEVNEDETDPTNPLDDVGHDFDGDGLTNEEEFALGTDPANPDTDGDGRPDGEEVHGDVPSNPLDPDSDGGGADDGTEVNIDETNPLDPTDDVGFDFDFDGHENSREPGLGLDPANPDTDFDGLCDGNGAVPPICDFGEDLDLDGVVDPNESDPRRADTDGGGVPDGEEVLTDLTDVRDASDDDPDRDRISNRGEARLGTDPRDADSDDDGLLDGEEFELETDPLEADTDGDLLLDGTELGVRVAHADTDTDRFVPDEDPSTQTDPLSPDTDEGGVFDGLEDTNLNGAFDLDETDPLDPDDDRVEGCLAPRDCDGDRLPDDLEAEIGTDPFDDDSDDDGLTDGTEYLRLPATDPLAPDTDGDGLCDGPIGVATLCEAGEDLDGDGVLDDGETDPAYADTDEGGVADGREVRRGTDPRDPSDDRKDRGGCGCGSAAPGGAEFGIVALIGLAIRRRRLFGQ